MGLCARIVMAMRMLSQMWFKNFLGSSIVSTTCSRLATQEIRNIERDEYIFSDYDELMQFIAEYDEVEEHGKEFADSLEEDNDMYEYERAIKEDEFMDEWDCDEVEQAATHKEEDVSSDGKIAS